MNGDDSNCIFHFISDSRNLDNGFFYNFKEIVFIFLFFHLWFRLLLKKVFL